MKSEPDKEIQSELQRLTQGLLYPSESDYPFEVVLMPEEASLPAALRQHLAFSEDTKTEEVPASVVFDKLAVAKDWHDERQKQLVPRFQQLQQYMENRLQDLRVVRLGEIEVKLCLIGKTPAGSWAGLVTTSVET